MLPRLGHLQALEAESIHIFREVAAEFQRPVMLYSIGKDSSVMLRLAQKAFHPGPIPFPVLHIDTGYKFREMIEFRDAYTARLGVKPDRPQEPGSAGRTERTQFRSGPAVLRTAEDEISVGRACERAVSTRHSAARGATRRSPAPRSGSTRSATRAGSGTRRTSGRSCGTCTTAASSRAKASGYSRSRTGPSWTSGNTSTWRTIPVVPLYFAQDREMLVRGESLIPLEQPFVPSAGRKAAAGAVPDAVAGLQPVHGRDPVGRRHGPEDHRGAGLVPPLGAREPGHRSRPGRLDGNQEARGVLLDARRRRIDMRSGNRTASRARTQPRTFCASRPPAAWTMASRR